MAKFMKVLKIILISILVLAGGACLVLYCVDKALAKQILKTAVDYANRPLPIVGVSSLVLAGLVWKIFQASGYGKKAIARIKSEYESEKQKMKEEYELKKLQYSAIISSYEREIDLVVDSVVEVCESFPNKKVNKVGERLKGDVSKIKEEMREKFNEIVDSDVEALIQSKEELVGEIVDLVKKEIVDKYGEEGQKALESISEAEKV